MHYTPAFYFGMILVRFFNRSSSSSSFLASSATTMMASKSSRSSISFLAYFPVLSLLLSLLFLNSTPVVFGGSIVEHLPGFDGKLPFKLETGYISVNDSEMFYYFVESQGNPQEDPLLLWLTGGPGCSSIMGLIFEIGPIEFDSTNYVGGLPTLRYYPYAWTKTASIIFLDSPIGTGFSYSRTSDGWPTSDSKAAEQAYQFLVKWLIENPQYLAVQLFVAGDSYSGMIVPQVTKKILLANDAKAEPYLTLKGYLLGSPWTDTILDSNSRISFAHRMALISDELYESAKTSCKGNYVNVDPSNTQCVLSLGEIDKCLKEIWKNQILYPKCVLTNPASIDEGSTRRSIIQEDEDDEPFMLSPPKIPHLWCLNFNYVMAYNWANDVGVQDALHVRQGTVENWKRCNKTISYTKDITSVVDIHRFLSTKGLQVLIDVSDRDLIIPFVGTEQWIESLGLPIVNDWRPWFVDGQTAGFTRKYSKNGFRLTYVTVKGGGHVAPEYHRYRCYHFFDRFIHYYEI